MCKEEKAAALTRALSCLKDLLTIEVWGETILKHLQANFIGIEQFTEFV